MEQEMSISTGLFQGPGHKHPYVIQTLGLSPSESPLLKTLKATLRYTNWV